MINSNEQIWPTFCKLRSNMTVEHDDSGPNLTTSGQFRSKLATSRRDHPDAFLSNSHTSAANEIGRISSKFDQSWSTLDQMWPISTQIGQILAKFGGPCVTNAQRNTSVFFSELFSSIAGRASRKKTGQILEACRKMHEHFPREHSVSNSWAPAEIDQTCSKVGQCWPASGHVWQTLANTRPIRAKLSQFRPNLAKVGNRRPEITPKMLQ